MVLPITGQTGKKKGKAGKRGKSKFGAPGPNGHGEVQVNLIVDPKAFQPPDTDDLSDEEEDEDDSLDEGSGMMPGGFGYEDRERSRRKKRKRRRRRGLVEGLKMEEEWKAARSWVKKITVVDVIGLILWGGAFVFIMIGQRCPSGGYGGW